MAIREDLGRTALAFLQSSKVEGTPSQRKELDSSSRIRLTDEEVSAAVSRAQKVAVL